MATNEKYNGYTNYQTWDAALWIDNDQGEQEMWAERAQEAKSAGDLADEMEGYYQDVFDEMGMPPSGMFSDLISHAFQQIDWYDIAENFFQEYHKDDEEESDDDEA